MSISRRRRARRDNDGEGAILGRFFGRFLFLTKFCVGRDDFHEVEFRQNSGPTRRSTGRRQERGLGKVEFDLT